jgi:AI-2 transport protein TqsA
MVSVPKAKSTPDAEAARPGEPKTPTPRDTTTRNAVVVIAVVVAGAAMKWLAPILTPLALALFLMVLVDSLARNLKARAPWLPAWAPMPAALLVSVMVFIATALIVAENAPGFVTQLLGYGPRLNEVIAKLASSMGLATPPSLNDLFTQLNPAHYVAPVAQGLQGFASQAVFVLIYVGFLIASRAGFASKAARLFPNRGERADALFAFHRIRAGIEQYLWIQTVLGAAIAIASWAIMAGLGLDNAIFWAFLIFVAGYIPIIGGAVGMIFPPIFALVQFTEPWKAGVMFLVLFVINFVAGNVFLPRMQGASLNLDPVVVLLSLAFWGAIWGVAGMFLSTPLTVMVMIILAQFNGSRWIAVLLSGDGHPEDASRETVKASARNPQIYSILGCASGAVQNFNEWGVARLV